MQLKPKRPPGHASRKALRYVREVRRLRAEGHTLESIRLALLDAGVSVSLSTVRREVARPVSRWELEHADDVPLALQELQHRTAAMSVMSPPPPALDASSGQPDSPVDGELAHVRVETLDDHRSVGLLCKVFSALHRLFPARWLP